MIQLPAGFRPTCMAHPPTYLNKLILGGDDGRMLLLNINSEEVLYTFAGWGSAVRCVEASPALDVIGVGLADGRALLHNVRYDETLMTFANASGVGAGNEGLLGGGAAQAVHVGGGACTAISFRCVFLSFFLFFFFFLSFFPGAVVAAPHIGSGACTAHFPIFSCLNFPSAIPGYKGVQGVTRRHD